MYHEVCYNKGTEAGGGEGGRGVNVGHPLEGVGQGGLRLPPPLQSYVMPATGLGLQARKNDTPSILQENVEIV